MNKVLHQFIEDDDIPKQYGGKLDFKFGDAGPNMDPKIKELLEFENGHTQIPPGPLYWVDRGDRIELKAVGSVNGQQRKESIAFLPKKVQLYSLDDQSRPTTAIVNGGAKSASVTATRPNLLTVPTAQEIVPVAASTKTGSSSPTEPTEAEYAAADEKTEAGAMTAIQEGQIIPASRPEPVSFVTAQDGIKTLTMDDAIPESANGGPHAVDAANAGPHKTAIANVLDPAINKVGPTEDAHQHHDVPAPQSGKPAGGAAEVASNHHHKESLKEKLMDKIHHQH